MFISRFASRIRQLEAERAKTNRREIATALSLGQITKRDLVKWGLLTAGGAIAMKNGLSPFAKSAYASVPTGAPRSPVGRVRRFAFPMPRPYDVERFGMTQVADPGGASDPAFQFKKSNGQILSDLPARRSSYHSLFNATGLEKYRNPVTGNGPIEGRPPRHDNGADYFEHQRWNEFLPKVGFLLSMGQIERGMKMHADLGRELEANAVWSCGPRYPTDGHTSEISSAPAGYDPSKRPGFYGVRTGYCNPPLIKLRYGEPAIMRIHNDLPHDRHLNRGFGRNELSTHFHNAHTAGESDGACNAFHFPGTFYDYHWSTVLARHDASIGRGAVRDKMDPGFINGDWRASTVDDWGKAVKIPGDYRELQSSMWFHDHRFFFTAENVQKGMYGLINMYSGPDNGNEDPNSGNTVSLRLPSGRTEKWGNTEFDINLAVTNPALDRDEQLTFDIFDTDGYLGDMLCVNGAFAPFLEVKKRRYRFRILNASMARFLQLALVDQAGNPLPFLVIANDGNLLPKPVLIRNGIMDQLGNGERFDIVVDFNRFAATVTKVYLVNLLYHDDGRGPEGRVSIAQAMSGFAADPAVGPFLEMRIGARVPDYSADIFGSAFVNATGNKFLTTAIPPLTPVRTRHFRFGRDSDGSARDPVTGLCTPDCGEAEKFPWAIKVNGQEWNSFNATRVSALVPAMGDVEHWIYENNSGGWDHPVHLHFEEGVTLSREGKTLPATERGARKDVWRTGAGGSVKVQVRFSEFTGAYVQHCHNTTHEDFSMIMRVQVVAGTNGQTDYQLVPTPMPTEFGVNWAETVMLPEAHPDFASNSGSGGDD